MVSRGVFGALAKRVADRDLTMGRVGTAFVVAGLLDVLNETVEDPSSDFPRLIEKAEASARILYSTCSTFDGAMQQLALEAKAKQMRVREKEASKNNPVT